MGQHARGFGVPQKLVEAPPWTSWNCSQTTANSRVWPPPRTKTPVLYTSLLQNESESSFSSQAGNGPRVVHTLAIVAGMAARREDR